MMSHGVVGSAFTEFT